MVMIFRNRLDSVVEVGAWALNHFQKPYNSNAGEGCKEENKHDQEKQRTSLDQRPFQLD